MPTFQVDGRDLFSLGGEGGPEGAVGLVLLHGAGGGAAMWTQLHATLRDDRPVYAIDLPGRGRSAPIDGPASVERYAAVVRSFLDAIRVDRAVMVGHSMGGAIAQVLALDSPDRVAGLVLVGSGSRLRVSPEILEGIPRDADATVERICRRCYGPAAAPDMVARGIAEMRKVAPAVLLDDFRSCDRFDVRERLGSIRMPTLVVVGDQDTMTPPKYATFLAERIEGARLETVRGAGHMVPVEAPAALVRSIRSFLTDL